MRAKRKAKSFDVFTCDDNGGVDFRGCEDLERDLAGSASPGSGEGILGGVCAGRPSARTVDIREQKLRVAYNLRQAIASVSAALAGIKLILRRR